MQIHRKIKSESAWESEKGTSKLNLNRDKTKSNEAKDKLIKALQQQNTELKRQLEDCRSELVWISVRK